MIKIIFIKKTHQNKKARKSILYAENDTKFMTLKHEKFHNFLQFFQFANFQPWIKWNNKFNFSFWISRTKLSTLIRNFHTKALWWLLKGRKLCLCEQENSLSGKEVFVETEKKLIFLMPIELVSPSWYLSPPPPNNSCNKLFPINNKVMEIGVVQFLNF